MEKQISDPNLIAEVYRNQESLRIPLRIEKHYDFIEISDDGLLLLGTSNLCGRIWSGSVWVFKECTTQPEMNDCVVGIEFDSSVASGLWLNNNQKVIVGCDSGSLYHLSINIMDVKDKNYFSTNAILTEHDDSILSLDFIKNKNKIISGGMDMNIKVWDEEALLSINSFCPAHGHIVTSISSDSESADIFASTSLDGTSLIWDTRIEKPASLILQNDSGYTASTWLDTNCIALGSNDGSVSLVDVRMKENLNQNYCSQRPIFKLKYNSELELLGICSDSPIVQIFSTNQKNLKSVYKSDQHLDFVRGLSWEKSVLYSCGWDSKIFFHSVKDTKPGNNL